MSDAPSQQHGNGDDVARLVRLGGRRQPVGQRRTERVRAAAHGQWQHQVRRRRTRRVAIWAAAGAAAMLIVAVSLLIVTRSGAPVGAPGASMIARVEAVAGSVTASGGPLADGDTLSGQTVIETATDGRVAIRLASGHSMRLDHDSAVRLLGDGDLALDRGAVYLDSGTSGAATRAVTLRSTFGRLEEIGTQFESRLTGDSLRVRLREGAVRLHRDGRELEIESGGELTVERDGTVLRGAIDPHAAAWDWVAGVTPELELDGRTAREFLDWAVRESGLRLAFEQESLARQAESIVLNGTTRGLTPRQAIDAVLPTCNLQARIEQDVLLISALGTSSESRFRGQH